MANGTAKIIIRIDLSDNPGIKYIKTGAIIVLKNRIITHQFFFSNKADSLLKYKIRLFLFII
jgi:hypothetical protein